MKFLLDTHVLIWWLSNHPNLSQPTIDVISNPDNLIFVSAASAWEIAIKKSIGKLDAPDDLVQQLEKQNFQPLSIEINHALYISKLPLHHNDPFDRILIAQAIIENLKLITCDPKFDFYSVSLLTN